MQAHALSPEVVGAVGLNLRGEWAGAVPAKGGAAVEFHAVQVGVVDLKSFGGVLNGVALAAA